MYLLQKAIERNGLLLKLIYIQKGGTYVVHSKLLRTPLVVLRFRYSIHLMGDELFTSVCVISVTISSKQITTMNDRYLKMAPSKGKTSRSGQVSDLHQKDNQKDQ